MPPPVRHRTSVRGEVASVEHIRDRDLVQREPDGDVWEPKVYPGVERLATGQDGRARRAARWLHIIICEVHASGVEPVEVRRLDLAFVAKAEVVVAEVVDDHDHDVLGARGQGSKSNHRHRPLPLAGQKEGWDRVVSWDCEVGGGKG